MSINNDWRYSGRVRHPSELADLFRAGGRKVTVQRQAIFRALYGDVSHPTAEAVHDAVRRSIGTISLKTVYQTLHELAELGEIAVLDLGTGTARFDPNVAHAHHHLVCRSCGKVRDLHADFSAVRVPEGHDAGFEVGSAEVVFRGRCEACRASGGDSAGVSGAAVGGDSARVSGDSDSDIGRISGDSDIGRISGDSDIDIDIDIDSDIRRN